MVWNSSSATAIRCRRASAIRPGSAKTSEASRAASRGERTDGKVSEKRGCPAAGASNRSSGRALQQLRRPPAQAAHLRLGGEQGAGVGLEKADVGARRRDGDLDGEDALGREPLHDPADQRRLAVAARRDEEDLLPFAQVARQPRALLLAVRERRRRHHFAVDERIGCPHYVIIRNEYADLRNRAAGGPSRPAARRPARQVQCVRLRPPDRRFWAHRPCAG